MPSATILHAACFAAGALLGGGLVTAVSTSSKKKQQIPSGSKAIPPIIDLGSKGVANITGNAILPPVLKYGNPGPLSDLLVRRAYTAAYDRRLRHPAWTAEHLTLESLGRSPDPSSGKTGGGDRGNSTFKEDETLPVTFRALLKDYFRSGYDRGHMVPAADAKSSQEAMDETFILSNIAPQVGAGFNRHYWAYLEEWCRKLTGSFSDVYVFTVPLYLPKLESDGKWRVTHEVIGSPPNVAVPTHFAKVVLTSRPSSPSTPDIPEISTGAFVLPNAVIGDDIPLQSFIVPVEAVERAAGLTLFSEELKRASKHICQTTQCDILVRRFDDAQKQVGGGKGGRPDMKRAISAP